MSSPTSLLSVGRPFHVDATCVDLSVGFVARAGRRPLRRIPAACRHTAPWHRAWLVLWIAAASLAGCASEDPGQPDRHLAPPDDLRRFLTDEAAAQLDSRGTFVLAATAAADELPANDAEQLADVYLRHIAPMLKAALELDRGTVIELSQLRRCGQTLYAESAFEPLNDAAPDQLKRVYGSWWLIGFCGQGGDIEVSVGVSALATHVRIASSGDLVFGGPQGNEFFSLGVPSGWASPVGESPERAAGRAATRAGRLVTRAPRLLAPDPAVAYPQGALWQVDLDRGIRLRNRVEATSRLFSGLGGEIGRALRTGRRSDRAAVVAESVVQPEGAEASVPVVPADPRGPIGVERIHVRRRSDRPIRFDSALVATP